jgi:hypothetical protein
MRNRSWMVIIGSLVLIAGLAAIGYLIYRAGVAQGAAVGVGTLDLAGPIMNPRPFLTGLLGFVLLLILLKFALRLILFPFLALGMGHRAWRYGHTGMRGKWLEGEDVPPFFKIWHERAHGTTPETTAETEDE